MPTPIILYFSPGDSLSTINAIVVGGGVAWGSASLPFTPLEFTKERIDNVLPGYNGPTDNKTFYEERYSQLPLAYQKYFHGTKRQQDRSVKGVAIGFSGGGILKGAANAVGYLLTKLLKATLAKLVGSLSLAALQSSQSGDALLRGMNGNDTFNLDINQFGKNTNVCIIQASAGVVAQIAVNIVFVGPFKGATETVLKGDGLIDYLMDVKRRSIAWAIVTDAAVGAILPGAQFQVIAS